MHLSTIFYSFWQDFRLLFVIIYFTILHCRLLEFDLFPTDQTEMGLYFVRVWCQRKWIPCINVNKESFGSKKYFAFVICMNPDLIPHSSSFIWSMHCSIWWRITRCKTFCRVIIRGHDKKFERSWYDRIRAIDWYKKWYISFVSNNFKKPNPNYTWKL